MALLARTCMVAGGMAIFGSACTLLVSTDGLSTEGNDASVADAARIDAGDAGDPGFETGPAVDGGDCDPGLVTAGLIAYYPFDEATGSNVRDCSGSGRDGLAMSPLTRVPGVRGGAIDLEQNCIDLQAVPSTLDGAFSISMWVSVLDFAAGAGFGKYILTRAKLAGGIGWRLGTDAPSTFKLFFVDVQAETPTGQPVSTWVHLAAVYEPAMRAEIFVNGARLVTRVPTQAPSTEAARLLLGCSGGLTDPHYFRGKIDELRIYGRALLAGEIVTLSR